jgi:hypothetical protein
VICQQATSFFFNLFYQPFNFIIIIISVNISWFKIIFYNRYHTIQ